MSNIEPQGMDEWAADRDRSDGIVDPTDLAELRATAAAALGDGYPLVRTEP